jgi:hypothetical protein
VVLVSPVVEKVYPRTILERGHYGLYDVLPAAFTVVGNALNKGLAHFEYLPFSNLGSTDRD